MTEYGQPFDDSLGDASGLSPYSVAQLFSFFNANADFVIADHIEWYNPSPLDVYATGAVGTVGIRAGSAFVKGYYYVLDANTTKNIDAAVNNRIDRIVLRRDSAAKTVRLVVIKGAEAANPSMPGLGAGDMALAWVWVVAGFNPAADQIAAEEIHDERRIWNIGYSSYRYFTSNLLHNSEFMAYSQPAAGNVPPEGWKLTAAPPVSVTGVTKLTNQPRGRGIRIQDNNANKGIQTKVRVTRGWYTLRCTVNITSGVAMILFSVSGVFDKIAYIRRTGVNQEVVLRSYIDADGEFDIYVQVGANVATDFTVGQILLSQGFETGNYRPQHETIMLDTALTDAAWTATAKSTGTTLINLSASFGSLFTTDRNIRGVILRLRGNDSGSSGAACGLYTAVSTTYPLSKLELGRLANDAMRDTVGFAPMIGGYGITFYLGVTATGAGTLDATVEIIGIIT